MKIGITEQGDPSIDFSWVEKLDTMDGAIIITKNLIKKVREEAMPYKDKIIWHVTCTGYGGTVIEPNIPNYLEQLGNAEELRKTGVKDDHIVIRIDPIIPTDKGLITAKKVFLEAYKGGFRRFRVSLLDCYSHVRERFEQKGLKLPYGDSFYPSFKMIENANHMFKELKENFPDIVIESCAEKQLTTTERTGCISKKDFDILGLDTSKVDNVGYQRKGCLCCSAKKELLSNKKQCPYGCLYCYWKNN